MANVQDIDMGWKNIVRELEKAKGMEVAVGIFDGSVAEYAAYNEFGTDNIPSRPFMATSFDENVAKIDADFKRQTNDMAQGKRTANQALTVIGQKHAARIQKTITGRNFLPRLADRTVRAKKGSTKTLVDDGAMTNAVQISIQEASPMSSFRKQKDVLREAIGDYVNGIWNPGSRTALITMASAQPVTSGQDMQALPEGRHMSDFVKIYTSDRLNVTADGEGIQPDIVVHEGYGYELVGIFASQSGVINHFKYIGAKIFKFTTTADWLSGALKRP